MGSMIYWLKNQRLVRVDQAQPGGRLTITYLATGKRAVISKRLQSSAAKEVPGCPCQACAAVRELAGAPDGVEAPLIVDTGETGTGRLRH
jgi:hypothetical protein